MKQDTFKQVEIQVLLNNAVNASSRPGKLPKGISEKRAKDLRLIAQELIAPLVKFTDEPDPDKRLLMPEELVFVLAASALFVQTKMVMGRTSLEGLSQEVGQKVESLKG